MENLNLYTINDIDYWLDDFYNTLEKIKKSNDPKRNNYLPENFDLKDQKDISIIYDDNNNLVAFSTIFSSPLYPAGAYRILNRFWKDELVRWTGYVSFIMVKHQIEICRELNASCGFISTEGNRSRWLKNWIDRAILKGFDFKQIDGMVKVCNGQYKNCWQNVGYIMLDEISPSPDFERIDYDVWKLMIDNGK